MLKKIFFLDFVICLSLIAFSQKLSATYTIKSSKELLRIIIPNSNLSVKDLPFIIGEVNTNNWTYGDILRKHQTEEGMLQLLMRK